MLRNAFIVLFGAIPASLFCLLALVTMTFSAVEFFHRPSFLDFVLFLAGGFGVWGTFSIWRVVSGTPIIRLRLGLLAGILAVLTFLIFIFNLNDESIPIDVFVWSVLPALVAAWLLIESFPGYRPNSQN